MVSPGEFIPLAEQSGLIRPMTDWLLARAVDQIAAWRAAGLTPGRVSINMSAHSFMAAGVVRLIDEVLARTGVPASQLVVEITEGTLMHDHVAALQVLNALRERQIGISSTTSAPAIRPSATSSVSPSTRSRSIAPSSPTWTATPATRRW